MPEPGQQNPVVTLEINESQVLLDGLQILSNRDVASDAVVNYQGNGVTGRLVAQEVFTDLSQQAVLGERIREVFSMPYIYRSADASIAGEDKLFFLNEQRFHVKLQITPELIKEVDIGELIRLTHWRGLGAQGFKRKLLRVIGIGANFGTQQFSGVLTLVDMDEYIPPLTSHWKRYIDLQAPFYWSSRERTDVQPPRLALRQPIGSVVN